MRLKRPGIIPAIVGFGAFFAVFLATSLNYFNRQNWFGMDQNYAILLWAVVPAILLFGFVFLISPLLGRWYSTVFIAAFGCGGLIAGYVWWYLELQFGRGATKVFFDRYVLQPPLWLAILLGFCFAAIVGCWIRIRRSGGSANQRSVFGFMCLLPAVLGTAGALAMTQLHFVFVQRLGGGGDNYPDPVPPILFQGSFYGLLVTVIGSYLWAVLLIDSDSEQSGTSVGRD